MFPRPYFSYALCFPVERYTGGAFGHVSVTSFGTQFTRGTASSVQPAILGLGSRFHRDPILIPNSRLGRGVADLDISDLGAHVSH